MTLFVIYSWKPNLICLHNAMSLSIWDIKERWYFIDVVQNDSVSGFFCHWRKYVCCKILPGGMGKHNNIVTALSIRHTLVGKIILSIWGKLCILVKDQTLVTVVGHQGVGQCTRAAITICPHFLIISKFSGQTYTCVR